MSSEPSSQDRPGAVRLAAFSSDASESAQIRRMRSYLEAGFDVVGFMFRRSNINRDFEPFWDNVPLGTTENENPVGRLIAIARGIRTTFARRDRLARTDVFVARNLDMLILAGVARLFVRPRPALVYECLDIHTLMSARGAKGALVRAVERVLLARTASLVVSSPAFVSEYFEPMQGWRGPVALVENKVRVEGAAAVRPAPPSSEAPPEWTPEAPLVLGWVGSLRCPASLDILVAFADHWGPRVRLEFHGAVHRHALPDFDEVVDARDNITWHGAYDYPDDLARIYTSLDVVWSQDLWQYGENSTWLLPNRIYEASYYGCPSIAVQGTETGRRVAAGLGWSIEDASAESLVVLVESLRPSDVQAKRAEILARPDGEFLEGRDEIAAAIRSALDGRN